MDPLRGLAVLNRPEIKAALEAEGIDEATLIEDKSWRLLSGSILSITGISGLAQGGVDLFFFDDQVRILTQGHGQFRSVVFADINELQFGGRGRHAVSSDIQVVGGGFGLAGAAKGIGEALVINSVVGALTRRELIESVVHLEWGSGSLTLVNEEHTPVQVAYSLRGVVADLNDRRLGSLGRPETASSHRSISTQLIELTQLWRDGALSDEEFKAAKAQVIS